MLRTALNAPRRLARRLRFFADDADPTELPQKPPPVCVPRAARRAYADKLAEQRRGWVSGVVRAAEPGGGGLAALSASLVSFALGALEPPSRLAAEHEELVAQARVAAAGDAGQHRPRLRRGRRRAAAARARDERGGPGRRRPELHARPGPPLS